MDLERLGPYPLDVMQEEVDDMSLESCDKEIYENGQVVAVLQASSETMEYLVGKLRTRNEFNVDWHFSCGRAVLKTLGDDPKQVLMWLKFYMPRIL